MPILKSKKNPYRLDRNITPLVYSLTLEPDLNQFIFRGQESVTFKARKAYSKITLHAAELKIINAFVCDKNTQNKIPARAISMNPKLETVTLNFGRILNPAEAQTLHLEFEGILNDKLHGFYRTAYEVQGKKRWGATTQFEATDARRAFPCWDEPDCKARFKISLIVPESLTALSNMPIEKQLKRGKSQKEIHYEITPVMSTYLVAFVIAELEYLEAIDKKGTRVRVYTLPGRKEQGRFALEVAVHALSYFADWFGIPYALPKCDMVALPDFASGAMENWGLITYRETTLLVDPKNSSAAARQRVAEVVDHELAHQWFGNLVTMRWWTDLWLNEGFASYMGPKAVHDQFPQWRIWDHFIVEDYLRGLGGDALRNTHPIEIPVQNPSEIREIFDAITYSKGSAVNRMLEHFLGEKVFRHGLRVYLRKFAFGNAATQDLWQVLQKVSGKPVKAIMASYTQQPGFPVLTVQRTKSNDTFKLRQQRFLFDGGKDKTKTLWTIPLVIRRAGEKKPWVGLFKNQSMSLSIGKKKSAWIKINAGQSGFYRTAYPVEMLDSLAAAIRGRSLPEPIIDGLGLLSDTLALARAGYLPTSKILEMIRAVQNEREYNIWALAVGGMHAIEGLLSSAGDKTRLAAYSRQLLAPCLHKISWEKRKSDTHSDLLLRSLLISQTGYFGDEAVIGKARGRFQEFLRTHSLEPNLRGPVYAIVARHGTIRDFESLLKIYRQSPLQEEKVRVLRALTRFRDPGIIHKVLQFALSPEVRHQDTYMLLAGFGANVEAREQAWSFNRRHIKELLKRYEGGSVSLLGHILEGSVTGFNTTADLNQTIKFFTKHPVAGLERTMKQSLEIIRSNIRWVKHGGDDASTWLSSWSAQHPSAS